MTGDKAVPKLAESIPTVTAPVRISEVRERRARYLANLITGGVLGALCVAGFVIYFAAGLAS